MEPSLSLILPVYNEREIVDGVFKEVQAFLVDRAGYRVVFVDDGSTDRTAGILEALIRESGDPRFSLIRCPQNGGKGRAIRIGVDACRTDLICFTDGDLAYDLALVLRLAEALAEHDVAIGSRALVEKRDHVTPLRRVLGASFNRIVRLLLWLPHRDTQAGIKGFRREAARAIFARQRIDDFAFDAELLYIARRLGLRIAEIPAPVRAHHTAVASRVDMLRDPLGMLGSLLRVRWNGLRGRYA